MLALWMGMDGLTPNEHDTRQRIASYLDHNKGLSFVATCGNELVGTLLSGTDGRRGFLQLLAVKPAFRGLSIATTLVENSVKAFAELGISEIRIFVMKDNGPAHNFWKKLGWMVKTDVEVMSFHPKRPE
nr:GNAT family N-acetyltransferase [Roseimicrobium sp. ORNL1]